LHIRSHSIKHKIRRLGLEVVGFEKFSRPTTSYVLPKELLTVEQALLSLAAAMKALEQLAGLVKICGFLMQMKACLFWERPKDYTYGVKTFSIDDNKLRQRMTSCLLLFFPSSFPVHSLQVSFPRSEFFLRSFHRRTQLTPVLDLTHALCSTLHSFCMLLTYNAQFFPIFNSIIEPFYSLLVYVIVLVYVWVCTILNTSNIIVVDEKICLKVKRLGYSGSD